MTVSFKKFSRVAAPFALSAFSATAVLADVTANQVWDNMQTYAKVNGYAIDADPVYSDGTLTLTNFKLQSMTDSDAGSFLMRWNDFALVEQPDGTVKIVVPPSLDISVEIEDPDAGEISVQMTETFKDTEFVASGDPDDLTFSVQAGEVGMTLNKVVIDGDPVLPPNSNIRFTFKDILSTSNVSGIVEHMVTSNLRATVLEIDGAIEVEEGERFNFTGAADNLTTSSIVRMPNGADLSDLADALARGYQASGAITGDKRNMTVAVVSPSGDMTFEVGTGPSQLTYAMSEKGLEFEGRSSDMQMSSQLASLPFPIDVTLGGSSVSFNMPVTVSKTAQPYGFGFGLNQLELSDVIWGLFDPNATLDRSPMTVDVELGGTAVLGADIFDPKFLADEDLDDLNFGEFKVAAIKKLFIQALGGSISAEGSFELDNSDYDTFDGFPRPEGTAQISFEGINGVIDSLIAAGLVPQEQAMGGRMMLGLFTRPVGDDKMVTDIEIDEKAHVYANGQRLR